MAAADSRTFPEQGVAQRVYGTFKLVTTGKESAGALSALAASYSIDGGAWTTCTNAPVQQGTTGIVYVDLTAAEHVGNHMKVKFSSSLANTIDVIQEWNPLEWSSKAGRGDSRFEELLRKVVEYLLNRNVDEGVTQTIYCDDDSTVSMDGSVSESEVSASRGQLA